VLYFKSDFHHIIARFYREFKDFNVPKFMQDTDSRSARVQFLDVSYTYVKRLQFPYQNIEAYLEMLMGFELLTHETMHQPTRDY
jgi:hypothetical protein